MHKTSSTGVSKGVEKYWNFLRGFLKNSDFLRGFLKKKFLRGSKIRNLVNGGVWILNGMAQKYENYENMCTIIYLFQTIRFSYFYLLFIYLQHLLDK